MVQDPRRFFDAQSESRLPLILTALTEQRGTVEHVTEARSEISKIYPWIRNEAWNPEEFARWEEGENSEAPELKGHGFWWAIPQEPRPFRNGAGLLRELRAITDDPWTMITSTLAQELSNAPSLFFGLCYPARTDGVEWLILNMPRQQRRSGGGVLILSNSEKREVFEKSEVWCFRVQSVRENDLRLRNTGVVGEAIKRKTVALIGLGALGSSIAELLAKAGVGTFRLCDAETLATANVARHIGGLSDFGAKKTRVVESRIANINPHIRVSKILSASAVCPLERLSEFIEPADLTICTIADENVETLINQVAVIERKTVLYGRALSRGSIGRVFLVRPGRDACKACLGEYARLGSQDTDWISITESRSDILLHECGRPVIPASAIDLSFIATLVARVALDVMEEREPSHNHWVWSRDQAIGQDLRLDRPLNTFCGRIERREDCSACQEPEISKVYISRDAYNSLISMAKGSRSLETCGILIGYVDMDSAIVLRVTGPGPEATRSKTICSRDVAYVQEQLDQASRELGTRGMYVGEWHTHLCPDARPSHRDIESLFGISKAPNYLTRCPVMLIAGLDTSSGEVEDFRAWSFPVGGRMYPIRMQLD